MKFVPCRSTTSIGRFSALLVIVGLATSLMAPVSSALNIKQTQALIAKLSSELSQEQARSEALGQKYDLVKSQLGQLNFTIAALTIKAAQQKVTIKATDKKLVAALIRSYVDGTTAIQGIPLFNLNVTQSDARKMYENQINLRLSRIQATETRQHNSLNNILAIESIQRAQAGFAESQLQSLLAQNVATERATKATLSHVSHDLVGKIVGYEIYVAIFSVRHHHNAAAAHAVAVATAVGGTSAGNLVIQAILRVQHVTNVVGSSSGSTAGLIAVAAAERQIGVPYVWGGETPGQGFDCSGLTQWAWAQAGRSIPRTAAEQYYATRRVPLNQLRPGDLLFYYNLDNDHQIDHEVMYVGSGPWGTNTIIAAAYTGTNISLEPLFTVGLYGAGRP